MTKLQVVKTDMCQMMRMQMCMRGFVLSSKREHREFKRFSE